MYICLPFDFPDFLSRITTASCNSPYSLNISAKDSSLVFHANECTNNRLSFAFSLCFGDKPTPPLPPAANFFGFPVF